MIKNCHIMWYGMCSRTNCPGSCVSRCPVYIMCISQPCLVLLLYVRAGGELSQNVCGLPFPGGIVKRRHDDDGQGARSVAG